MPPQQPDRLLDLVHDILDFRAHGRSAGGCSWSMIFSENRYPPRIKCGAGFFGIMLSLREI
jgi:hypothetical protein